MMPIYRNLITNHIEIGRVDSGKFVECLSYVHDVFFSDLETVMASVVEALKTFEEASEQLKGKGALIVCVFNDLYFFKAAIGWLVSEKTDEFEKRCKEYTDYVFPSPDSPTSTYALPEEINFTEQLMKHRVQALQHSKLHVKLTGLVISVCNSMREEVCAQSCLRKTSCDNTKSWNTLVHTTQSLGAMQKSSTLRPHSGKLCLRQPNVFKVFFMRHPAVR